MHDYTMTIPQSSEKYIEKFKGFAQSTGCLTEYIQTKDAFIFNFEFENLIEQERFKKEVAKLFPSLYL